MKKKNVMNRVNGLALLAVGSVLVLWGYNESESLGSHLTRLYSGTPSHNAFYYFIGGGVCILLGTISFFRK